MKLLRQSVLLCSLLPPLNVSCKGKLWLDEYISSCCAKGNSLLLKIRWLLHMLSPCLYRYSKQSFIIDLIFPPLNPGTRSEVLEDSEFNEFTYWRQTIADTPEEAEVAKFLIAYPYPSSSRKIRPSPSYKK